MRKTIAILTVLVMTVFAASAFAQFGGGRGQGQGFGGQGFGGNGFNANATVNSESDAIRLVQDYVAQNFAGYTVGNAAPVAMPMGTAYYVYVNDSVGNDFTFMVGMHGVIHGPAAGKQAVPQY
jgi:hypothetical protein